MIFLLRAVCNITFGDISYDLTNMLNSIMSCLFPPDHSGLIFVTEQISFCLSGLPEQNPKASLQRLGLH